MLTDRRPGDRRPPVQSLHDGGEQQTNSDHQHLHSQRALAGGDAAARDRWVQELLYGADAKDINLSNHSTDWLDFMDLIDVVTNTFGLNLNLNIDHK